MNAYTLFLLSSLTSLATSSAYADVAPGEDPVALEGKVTYNMLPLNNALRSAPANNATGVPAWIDAKIARFEAKAFSADTSGILTDKDVTRTVTTDGMRKTCIQEVGNINAANGPGAKYGMPIESQIVVIKGDLVNICK